MRSSALRAAGVAGCDVGACPGSALRTGRWEQEAVGGGEMGAAAADGRANRAMEPWGTGRVCCAQRLQLWHKDA